MIVNGFEFICGINKTVMYKDKFVFAQLPRFLDRNHSNNLIKKYEGGKYIKSYTFFCNQLLTMVFDQLSNQGSLRD